jgi:pimeloyl-ACP methyl ester carboxylesterase
MDGEQTRTLRLKDGRTLAYAEYGDPNGRPVFYFHGFPSCHLEVSLADATARQRGFRLIAIDRPGFGRSDFQRNRAIGDWPADVQEVAEQLGIERFAVLGVSGGGPYAAACAAKIPQLVTKAAIVSGWGPVDRPAARSGLRWSARVTLALWRRVPLLVRLAMWYVALNARLFPRLVLRFARRQLPPADQRIVDRPEVHAMMLATLREVFRRGSRGLAREAWLFARPWGFRLQDIAIDVLLWHGEADLTVPVSMGRYVASAIPRSRAKYYPNEGHFMVFDHMDEVLSALVG